MTGNVSYDPENHQHMTNTRAQKIANVAQFIGDQEVDGPDRGDLLVVSWGGTFGALSNRGSAVPSIGGSTLPTRTSAGSIRCREISASY